MPRQLLLLNATLMFVLGAGCAAARSVAPEQDAAPRQEAVAQPGAAPARPAAAPAPPVAAKAGAAPQEAAQRQNLPGLDRMIIRTVTMTISVANVQEAYRQVERIVAEQNGLIAGSQIRQDGDRTTATMTVRVPADPATYQVTLERLRGIAERVVDEQAQAQDITEEYVDLESRLRNLRASEESLLALLSRAQRVEDILAIQRELTNVRGQIEQIQGRKQALERRADMATITLQIREISTFARAGWNPGETVLEALRSLAQAARGLATAAIWILVWTPLWGGLLVLLWLARRFIRNPFRMPRRLVLDPPRGAAPPASAGPA